MAISLITGGALTAFAQNGDNVTLTFPTGGNAPIQNDVVFLYGGHAHRASSNLGPSTLGYTQAITPHTAAAPNFGVWYKVMTATPDTTVVGFGSGNLADVAVYSCYILRGVDTANPLDQTPTTAGPTTSTNPDAPAIVTQTANAWVLALAGSQVNDTSRGTVSGYSNLNGSSASDSQPFSSDGATLAVAVPASTNPPAWSSWGSGAWYAASIAVKPFVASATTFPGYIGPVGWF